MGLFGGKYITTVGTSVSRVIEDKHLPGSATSGTLRAVLQGEDVPGAVMEELLASIGVKAERLYTFGKNHYLHGLPTAQNFTVSRGRAEVAQVLQALEGAPVVVEYSHFGPPNNLHMGWMALLSNHGYNPATNQLAVLTAAKGTPVYLRDMVVVIPTSMGDTIEPQSLQQWGIAANAGYTPSRLANGGLLQKLGTPTPIEISSSATIEMVRVLYEWETTTTVYDDATPLTRKILHTDSLTIPVNTVDDAADFFHAKYTVGGVTKYWMYQAGTGVYPTLDAVFLAPAEEAGSFFPFTYFRYNKQPENQDTSSEAYRDSKKLVNYLGMDFDTVADAIHENPDIADVEQAMMMFAVPAETTDPMEQRYLYQFFDKLYGMADEQFASAAEADIWGLFHGNGDISRHALVIQDARFKMVLSDAGIYKTRKPGSIGELGAFASTTGSETVSETYTIDIGNGPVEQIRQFTVPQHIYRYQITETLYDEITVVNLKTAFKIWDGHYTTEGDNNDVLLLIPLDHSITEQYSIPDREILYARSLHYVFNSRVVTKLKWYQTGLFKVIMIIIAIVITIYTGGSDGGQMLAAALGTSGATATAINVIFTLVVGALIGKALTIVFKAVVKLVGEDVALILAAIAIIYGGYELLQSGSLNGAPWAQELLSVANGLTTAVIDAKFEDLLGDFTAFQAQVDSQLKTLEDTKKLLDSNNALNPFIIFGESPNDFYNRTVHSGNIGVKSIEAISSYVDIALTLPTINDTIGT